MKPRAVDFVSYGVTDMDRSEAFYRDVLGLEVEVARGKPGTRASGYMELDAGGTAISLTVLPQLHPNGIVALAVEDVHAAVEELRTFVDGARASERIPEVRAELVVPGAP